MSKVFYILIVICLANIHLFAQRINRFDFKEIPSTSIYDIYSINDNRIILACKNGIVAECDTNGNIKTLKETGNATNLLKSERINDSLVMVIGDKGIIYTFNTFTNEWQEEQLMNYKNKALYNICNDKKGNIYINGGNSKIACGQKAIPNGFILKSENGGKNWKRVYNRKSKMVWDIKYNFVDNKLYAIVFSPFGSKLIYSSNEGKTWKTVLKSEKKDLFHALYINADGKIMISGGTYAKNGGRGAIYEIKGNQYIKHTTTYFVWDIVSAPDIDIASCSKGWIIYRLKSANSENWHEIHSTADYNLYEVEKISDSSFILGGSRNTLIRFDLDAPCTSLKN